MCRVIAFSFDSGVTHAATRNYMPGTAAVSDLYNEGIVHYASLGILNLGHSLGIKYSIFIRNLSTVFLAEGLIHW